jgi:hypothetical protein
MGQSHSCQTNSHSVSQEILRFLIEPEGSLMCSQEPANSPYLQPGSSSQHSPTLFP